MVDFYSAQQIGVADGTQIPAAKADGGQVGANVSTITASKLSTQALTAATSDRLFLGRVPAGSRVSKIFLTTDTSLSTTTIAIGTTASPAKYCTGRTLTVTDTPTAIGPRASVLDDGLLAADEDLWATFTTTNVAAAVLLTFEIEITRVK